MLIKPLYWQRLVRIFLVLMTLVTLAILFFIIIYILSKGLKVITPERVGSIRQRSPAPLIEVPRPQCRGRCLGQMLGLRDAAEDLL